jgi:hypothetical protein
VSGVSLFFGLLIRVLTLQAAIKLAGYDTKQAAQELGFA